MPTTHEVSSILSNHPLQGMAVLLICRLAFLFCAVSSFSAAEIAGVLLATVGMALLLAPLLLWWKGGTPHPSLQLLYGVFAAFWAARVLVAGEALLAAIDAPYPPLTAFLLLLAAAYAATLPLAATGRAMGMLLTVTTLAVAILCLRSLPAFEPLSLWTSASNDSLGGAIVREFARSGELAFLPLLMQRSIPHNRRLTLGWLLGRGVGIPLLMGACLLRNGRLLQWMGSPLFLWLARAQRLAAFRTDGFWQVLTLACAAGAVIFSLQILWHTVRAESVRVWHWRRLVPLVVVVALTMLFRQTMPLDGWFAGAVVLLGIVVPYGTLLWEKCVARPRKTSSHAPQNAKGVDVP